jgi:hypothetical protein
MPKLPVKRYSLFDCLSNATTGLCVTYSVSAVATEASAIELRPIEIPQQYGPDNTGEGADSGDTALSDRTTSKSHAPLIGEKRGDLKKDRNHVLEHSIPNRK